MAQSTKIESGATVTPQEATAKSLPILLALDYLPAEMQLVRADGTHLEGPLEVGEMLLVVSVMAAHVVNDIRENIRNLVGGRMNHYERLVEGAVQTAMDEMGRKAQDRGYDGVLGVKISHPTLVEGGVEVVVYGNGFRARVVESSEA